MARPPCTPMKVAIDGSTRPSSIATMPSTQRSRPGQPGPSYARPAMPSSAMPGDEVVRELRAGPVLVDDRLDLARHEGAHLVQQLAVLVVQQQLEAEEVRER